jgi:hypothetical protein
MQAQSDSALTIILRKRFSRRLACLSLLFAAGLAIANTSDAATCRIWTIVSSPNVGAVNNLKAVAAISPTDIWAVGNYNNGLLEVKPGQWTNPNPNRTLALNWNGARWSQVPSPNTGAGDNYLEGVAAISHSDVWAVGHYNQARIMDDNGYWQQAGPAESLILHWDGKAWKSLPAPDLGNVNTRITAISAIAKNDVWASGYYGDNDDPYESGKTDLARTLVLHWNGTRWSIVPSPDPGPSLNRLRAVSAVSKNNVWVAGDKSGTNHDANNGIDIFPLILHWDGKLWKEAVLPDNTLYGNIKTLASIKAFPNSVLSVGLSGAEGSVSAMSYRQSSTHWLNVDVPSPQSPTDAQPDNILTAVGGFSSSNAWAVGYYSTEASNLQGSPVKTFILRWDGKLWTRVPSPNSKFTASNSNGTFDVQDNELTAITALPTGDVWAVGSTGGQSSLAARTLIMRYNKGACMSTQTNIPSKP